MTEFKCLTFLEVNNGGMCSWQFIFYYTENDVLMNVRGWRYD